MASHHDNGGVKQIFGKPPLTIREFGNHDLLASFVSGAIWGGIVIGILAVGAWIISVARNRVRFSTGGLSVMRRSLTDDTDSHNQTLIQSPSTP